MTARVWYRRPGPVLGMLGVIFIGAGVISLLAGAVPVTPGDLGHMLRWRLGAGQDPERLTDSVLWAIRLPRVLAGFGVGAALAVAGTALQGTFRNRMADPHLVGVSPAAGLGAVAGIALTPVGGHPLLMLACAAGAGVVATMTMRWISQVIADPNQFVLVGLALGLGLLAWLGAIVLAWDSPRVPTFTFWVFGGLGGSTWTMLGVGIPVITLGCGLIAFSARSLDLLTLGESEAQHLGVAVGRAVKVLMVGAGLAVGGAVGLGGAIGFVGLVVPLLLRHWLGPVHRTLIPASALAGAAAVVAMDAVARTVAAPVEIPVGLITAMLGAPLFVWLLLLDRSRRV